MVKGSWGPHSSLRDQGGPEQRAEPWGMGRGETEARQGQGFCWSCLLAGLGTGAAGWGQGSDCDSDKAASWGKKSLFFFLLAKKWVI